MWDRILQLLVDSGPATVLFAVAALVGAAMQWWVWGTEYRRMVTEMEYWRDKTFEITGLGEKAVDVAADLVDKK